MKAGNALAGVALMAAVALVNAFDAVIVRLLAGEIHPFVIGFTRTFFGLLVMAPLIIRRPAMLRTRHRWMHVWRALLKLASLVALFAALGGAPLASVTAIQFAAPVFVAIGAWAILKEASRPLRLIGAGLGFVGVLIILAPGLGTGEGGVFLGFALLAALLTAAIQLILKVMGGRDRGDTLVAWNLILTVPIALIPALVYWTDPTPAQWGLLALQGALGALNQFMVTRALQMADVSLVAPIEFLRLPLVAALAYLFFGEIAGPAVWIGAPLIFLAVVLIATSARRRPNDTATAPIDT